VLDKSGNQVGNGEDWTDIEKLNLKIYFEDGLQDEITIVCGMTKTGAIMLEVNFLEQGKRLVRTRTTLGIRSQTHATVHV
jgi:hypothetical protein